MVTVKSDVTIIGGGIIGLCVANSLAKKQFKVTIVEKDSEPKHASWAAAGVLSPLHFEKYPAKFISSCFDSMKLYPALCDEIERETLIDAGLKRCGMNILMATNSSGADNNKLLGMLSRYQARYEIVNRAELQKMYSFLSDRIKHSVFLPDIFQIRNDIFIKGLKKLLVMRGVRFIYERATNIEKAGLKIKAINSRQYKFTGRYYVLSAGPWSYDLLSGTDINLTVEPIKGYIILARNDRYGFSEILSHNEKYVVPRSNGYYLLGSTLDKAGFDTSIQLGKIAEVLDSIKSFIPDVIKWELKMVWIGLRPKFKGRNIPLIDFHPEYKNLVIAAGHYRNGILLAPLTGNIVTSKILNDDINSDYEGVFGIK